MEDEDAYEMNTENPMNHEQTDRELEQLLMKAAMTVGKAFADAEKLLPEGLYKVWLARNFMQDGDRMMIRRWRRWAESGRVTGINDAVDLRHEAQVYERVPDTHPRWEIRKKSD
jgi:hypothetical protein